MVDQLVRLNDEQLLFLTGMIVFASIVTTVVTAIIAVQVRKLRERQLELGFKDDLLRRGIPVDEAVRLMTCRRPTWSQSLMSLGDWMALKLSRCWQGLSAAVPSLLRSCRHLCRTCWQHTTRLVRVGLREGWIWGRIAWRQGSQFCRTLWRDARPILRSTMRATSDGVHWLAHQTDRLARRLSPHRP